MHRGAEPSRLQSLALQLADKVPWLINECVGDIELVGRECELQYRFSKNVSPKNGGFIRATELAPRLLVGKAKSEFYEN